MNQSCSVFAFRKTIYQSCISMCHHYVRGVKENFMSASSRGGHLSTNGPESSPVSPNGNTPLCYLQLAVRWHRTEEFERRVVEVVVSSGKQLLSECLCQCQSLLRASSSSSYDDSIGPSHGCLLLEDDVDVPPRVDPLLDGGRWTRANLCLPLRCHLPPRQSSFVLARLLMGDRHAVPAWVRAVAELEINSFTKARVHRRANVLVILLL